jgi:pyruvyltransferase
LLSSFFAGAVRRGRLEETPVPSIRPALRGFVGPHLRRAYRTSRERQLAARRQRPAGLRRLVAEYEVSDLIEVDGRVPVLWWTHADNFGDVLSPWLIAKMTGREVVAADPDEPHYVAIGSILRHTSAQSHVWGAGSFGTEDPSEFTAGARYSGVRGPLSRVRLRAQGITVPKVFGDPALLVPAYFAPRVRKTHTYGVVARWSERRVLEAQLGPDVRLIDLGTTDVEGVIEAMLSCRFIVTGSLHGLVMADAYGIPSAWRMAKGAEGGAFKFFDYFSSVDKFRNPQKFDMSRPVTAARLRDTLDFDARPITFDHRALLDACPFLRRAEVTAPQRSATPAVVQGPPRQRPANLVGRP